MCAEVNIDLEITFECPHCEAVQQTSEHDLSTSISVGSHEVECTKCTKSFDLNINESY
ncbi:Uncharacterized phage protein [Moritella viscosa]|uniref:Valyl-tRNA synthetase n=1 Tax=Moritella viscosa TaxID=80854 RepID=A0ABY1H8G8_9GAMM|nr:hypothetical protein [Moritella viscosa]CED61159.1 putative uncharacterized phage gene [Moritella viscosa]SGY85178.1 Valyl-tRNA synthetase [Moritella viscosa]SGY87429.1 Valyl-tRNA synthetase [Moritella viscosa]SHN99519.1 Valyl-tRNA synthetase [Moritella viscosa]SHO20128.1 Valyl-tRNA synthetase [Moritella viscosa]